MNHEPIPAAFVCGKFAIVKPIGFDGFGATLSERPTP